MRDNWNNLPEVDDDQVKDELVAILKKGIPAKDYSYSEVQELRISSELCDRSHFVAAAKRIADKAGDKLPAGLAVVMEDLDFDRRTSFMKAVVEAVDPAPVAARVRRR